jgi:hypothetical protein
MYPLSIDYDSRWRTARLQFEMRRTHDRPTTPALHANIRHSQRKKQNTTGHCKNNPQQRTRQ